MCKYCAALFFVLVSFCVHSQIETTKDSATVAQDSIRKSEFLHQLGNGYFPTKYVDVDLRYLIKFNQFEGLRTGLGGVTNKGFSKNFRLVNYVVYGFKDHTFKYSIGGGFRANKDTNTWINLSYTDDLQETGSSNFLTDKRFFSFFEPRLLNISLFHKHITKAVSVEHSVSNNLLTETQVAISKINPTYDYGFIHNNKVYNSFDLTIAKVSLQWNPFNSEKKTEDASIETKEGYPQFTLQYTKSFKDISGGDFNFSKIDFRTFYKLLHSEDSFSSVTLTAGYANGNAPLTHLYHAYPNNITKETIMQRFSVASINGFETMFFNEFFSDRFATLQFKHYLNPFNITHWFKPQLVFINRFALGNMKNPQQHQGISFSTLDKVYSETGFEINKLLFGFGLSFAYRYGGYHLPELEDNIAFKFTFNVTL
jgi:hypothetical protein